MSSNELKACPNRECRSTDIEVLWYHVCGISQGIYRSKCFGCKMTGPEVYCRDYTDPEDAIVAINAATRLWNALPRDGAEGGESDG